MRRQTDATQSDSAMSKVRDENEEDMHKKPITRAYARKSAISEPNAVQPPDLALDKETLKGEPQTGEGELTKELSDLTDAEDAGRTHSTSLSFYTLLAPFLHDTRLCLMTIANFVIALLSFIIFLTTAIFLIKIFDINKTITKIGNHEQPCLYQWSEWGPCSETCLSSSRLPFRTRRVLNRSIVQARGRFPSCPKNLATMVEHMPCNIYRCPVPLSSITNWTQCVYKDPNILEAGGCYRMRDLPTTNQLFYIDIDDIVQDCQCPDHIP